MTDALTAHTKAESRAVGDVEAVARIIDPEIFKDRDNVIAELGQLPASYSGASSLYLAFRKAETIIAALQSSARVVESGWQVVPVEPTVAMWEEFDYYNGDKYMGRDNWLKAWSAMLAAAPRSDEGEEVK